MSADNSTPKDTFVSHLMELRDRLLRAVIAVLVLFVIAAPHGPFFVPFKFAFAVAVAVAIPYLLYQVWAFVAPGLYAHEKVLVYPLLISSTLLFYLGIAFAYFLVFPIIFAFFASTAPEGVAVMTDINAYLSFAMKLFFAFGVAFEVPIATMLLVKAGVTTPENLARKRPYIIVGAFIVGMLLTPPDIFSQTMLAVPVWVLFELGLLLSRRFKPKPADTLAGELDDDELDDELSAAASEIDELERGKTS